MDNLAFKAEIDLPLSAVILIGFLLHFNAYARSDSARKQLIDLESRLPVARYRVVALFVAIVSLCWLVDVTVWALILLLFAMGTLIGLGTGIGNAEASGALLLSAAFIIRDWAFGFPQFILRPPEDENLESENSIAHADLVGACGTVISPLRPGGEAEINGRVFPVVSDDGQLIDAGTAIVVSGTHPGRICVRPCDTSADDCR